VQQEAERLPFSTSKPINEMNLVEIAEQLEKVTSWIEAQRVKEREARVIYQAVAQGVEGAVGQIRHYAQQLVDAQSRKVSSFGSMLTKEQAQSLQSRAARPAAAGATRNGKGKMNIADAILSIWSLDQYHESLTTEEIGDALPETGYKSNAAPTSLKSSINQALAKLCRAGAVVRFRSDGSRIPARDNKSRARKYIAATLAGEE
jgi:hypothetical protein